MPDKQPRPASHFRLNLGGRENVGMFRECIGPRLRDRRDRAEVGRRQRPAGRAQDSRRHEVVEHHAEAWRRREPRPVEVAGHRDQARSRIRARGRHDRASRLRRLDDRDVRVQSGLAAQILRQLAQRGGNEVAIEELHICHEGLERQ